MLRRTPFITLEGQAIGNLGLVVVLAIIVVLAMRFKDAPAQRPEAREPVASEIERLIAGSQWGNGIYAWNFTRDHEILDGKKPVGTWRAIDGSIRIRSNRGEVGYATIEGETLVFGETRLVRVAGPNR